MAARLKLDSNGEIDLTNGSPSMVDGVDALVQKLAIVYQFFVGDWFLDPRKGIPHFQQITRKGINEGDVFQIYFDATANTTGVAQVDELTLEFQPSGRRLDVTGRVTPVNETEAVSVSATIGGLL